MPALLLSLVAALGYGLSDFVGGMAARKVAVLRVVVVSYPVGMIGMLLIAPLAGGSLTTSSVVYGALSGLVGGCAILWFYAALASGPMSVVSPLTSLLVAGLPLGVGMLWGERPGTIALIGAGLAVVAVVLVSRTAGSDGSTDSAGPAGSAGSVSSAVPVGSVGSAGSAGCAGSAGSFSSAGAAGSGGPAGGVDSPLRFTAKVAWLTFGSGAAFAIYFVLLDKVGSGTGLWPLVISRATATVLVLVAAAFRRQLRPPAGVPLRLALTAGALDVLANVAFLYALRAGLLSLVSVLTSLYPAATVLLARFVLRERTATVQRVGLVLAAVAVAMIAGASATG